MGQEEKRGNAFPHTSHKILVIQPQKLLIWALKSFPTNVGNRKEVHKRLWKRKITTPQIPAPAARPQGKGGPVLNPGSPKPGTHIKLQIKKYKLCPSLFYVATLQQPLPYDTLLVYSGWSVSTFLKQNIILNEGEKRKPPTPVLDPRIPLSQTCVWSRWMQSWWVIPACSPTESRPIYNQITAVTGNQV